MIRKLIEQAFDRVGFLEFLLPFIPILMDIITNLLKQCTDTEAEAVTLMAQPTDRQLDMIHVRVHRRLWWKSRDFRRLSRSERNEAVSDAVWAVHQEAVENPTAVKDAFREANSV